MPSDIEPEGAPHLPQTLARLRAFYARHPDGAVRTSLVRRGTAVVVRAAAYRADGDRRPMATALAAWERERTPPGDRTDGALRRAESRAILQALEYLGVGPAPAREPAREQATREPATRATRLPADPYARPHAHPHAHPLPATPASARRGDPPTDAALRERVSDLEALIAVAAQAGLRPARAAEWRRRLRLATDRTPAALDALDRAERRLRRWVARDEPL